MPTVFFSRRYCRSWSVSLVLASTLSILVLVGRVAHAQTFSGSFPLNTATTEGSVAANASGFNPFFKIGDGVRQSYTGTGLTNVMFESVTLNYYRNNLTTTSFVTFNVNLIGATTTTVGTITANQATSTGSYTYNFSSAAVGGSGVNGDNYTLEIVETNAVAGGGGSIGIGYAATGSNTLTLTAAPEPGAMTLMGICVLPLAGYAIRGRRAAADF